MICMGIDAAGRTAGVALTKDGQLLYECFVNGGLSHSETLMGLVDGAFKATGLAPTDLDLYGVCAGPGSFTGLRIGLATVIRQRAMTRELKRLLRTLLCR